MTIKDMDSLLTVVDLTNDLEADQVLDNLIDSSLPLEQVYQRFTKWLEEHR